MGFLSNGDLFDGSSNNWSFYNGYCTFSGVSLKYKKRKVYAVRHFPPGCGQNASFINMMPQDTEVVASLGDKENLVADERMVKVAEGDCVKAFEIGNESSSHQLVESSVKLELPNILNDLLGKVVVAVGKVNGAELFPVVVPLGRRAPENCLGKQDLIARLRSLSVLLSRETVRTKEECSLVRKTTRIGIEELDRDVRDTNAKKRDMKKKLLPSGKVSYENKGALVVKDKGDFSICEQDEDSLAVQRPHDFQVILPPFGPDSSSHGNVRNKVRETQRLFQAICRKLLQGEEANLKKQGY
ncbi:Histone-lysine N-methyltransferase, H3 lysine-9 specific SUVH6 [Camellia lanceoleosa]|nr:Histone-lysine N-methyltransferase, H3 lysine-9 specific SUVH6 [Camellia lanceoleosa]